MAERFPDVTGLGWMGIRTVRFEETVAFYRDLLQLPVLLTAETAVHFQLGDGTELHVYRADDPDHQFFGDGPVVGLAVSDATTARAQMERAGIDFIGEPQEADGIGWSHFRGPDGNVYEIIGPLRGPSPHNMPSG